MSADRETSLVPLAQVGVERPYVVKILVQKKLAYRSKDTPPFDQMRRHLVHGSCLRRALLFCFRCLSLRCWRKRVRLIVSTIFYLFHVLRPSAVRKRKCVCVPGYMYIYTHVYIYIYDCVYGEWVENPNLWYTHCYC